MEAGYPDQHDTAITSSILGAGATRRVSAVRWGVTRQIFLSWLLTVPVAALLGAVYVFILRPIT